MRIRVKHVHTDRDRHGNVRVYFQKGRGAPKVRLPAKDDPAFLDAYNAAMLGAPVRVNRSTFNAGTFGAMIEAYCTSPEFKALRFSTQTVRRRILDKLKPDHGHKMVADMQPRHVRELRNEGLTPHAANNRLKVLKTMGSWAVEVGLMETNPARDVPKIKIQSDGHQPWSADEIARYRARHKTGTKARLALELYLYTGARRGDGVTLGRQMMQNGALRYRQGKTGKRVMTPIAKPLQDEIDQLPTDQVIFLLTEYGKPFSVAGFGAWFRKRCNEAKVHKTVHGLRKSIASMAAEAGATASQLQAFGGWASMAEAEKYARAANQEKMAGDVVRLVTPTGKSSGG